MDAVVVGALSSVVVCVMILLGMHVGVSLALTSVIGVYFISGKLNVGLRMLESTAYNALNDYIFAVIPLFILMGAFATASGVMRDLFNSMEALLQRVRGGLGIATVAGNAVFSAITGVTVAGAVVFSQISIPEMRRLGYNKKFALGIVASSALLGNADSALAADGRLRGADGRKHRQAVRGRDGTGRSWSRSRFRSPSW